MTDVWTSIGVVVAVVAVERHELDRGWTPSSRSSSPRTSSSRVSRSCGDRRSVSWTRRCRRASAQDRGRAGAYRREGIDFHAIRTRAAAGRSFVSMHVLVPGEWTIQRGHDLVEQIEQEIAATDARDCRFTHLEPLEDPISYRDEGLDRTGV